VSALRRALTFIRFSHTIFALPFALGSMIVAANGFPSLRLILLIVLAMVFARTAAMIFNRLADWQIDQENPRTAARHRLIPRQFATALLIISSILFVLVTWQINAVCFALSPAALGIVFLYSLTKRFTDFSHFFLGLALAISPIGAWLAVRGRVDLPPLILAFAVLCWVAGFDLIYATQDEEFDRRAGLHSLVVRWGPRRALIVAQCLHLIMWFDLVIFGVVARLGAAFWWGTALILCALFYEHRSARQSDPVALNRAFFASNAFVSFIFVGSLILDRLF
jgi:4-hydroxybenzoate polyprenyltransferase